MKRTLVLKKELLTELTTDELRHIAGAYDLTPACPTRYCASTRTACLFSDLMTPCLTD